MASFWSFISYFVVCGLAHALILFILVEFGLFLHSTVASYIVPLEVPLSFSWSLPLVFLSW